MVLPSPTLGVSPSPSLFSPRSSSSSCSFPREIHYARTAARTTPRLKIEQGIKFYLKDRIRLSPFFSFLHFISLPRAGQRKTKQGFVQVAGKETYTWGSFLLTLAYRGSVFLLEMEQQAFVEWHLFIAGSLFLPIESFRIVL